MFEQKNHGQDEQKSTSLDISSPEVTANAPRTDRIILSVQSDTRSQSEIFDSLKQRILNDAAGQLDESQAIEATRNLLNFFESAFQITDGMPSNNVDLQGVNGNVGHKEK
jgi:hypothetical protein